ncbi:hypothetical protein [Lysobacter gummosus]|uniref:hypothetical protein n=1 Tax=Lysobacter gummosus TaxID=262324 RepID=UPI003627E16F
MAVAPAAAGAGLSVRERRTFSRPGPSSGRGSRRCLLGRRKDAPAGYLSFADTMPQ